jgi:hypothetical protein
MKPHTHVHIGPHPQPLREPQALPRGKLITGRLRRSTALYQGASAPTIRRALYSIYPNHQADAPSQRNCGPRTSTTTIRRSIFTIAMNEEPRLSIPVEYRLSSANTRAFFAQGVWLPPYAPALKPIGASLILSSGAPMRKRSPTEEHENIYHKGSTPKAGEAARTARIRSLWMHRHCDDVRNNQTKTRKRQEGVTTELPTKQLWRHTWSIRLWRQRWQHEPLRRKQ